MTTAAAALIARREYTICSPYPRAVTCPGTTFHTRAGVYSHKGLEQRTSPTPADSERAAFRDHTTTGSRLAQVERSACDGWLPGHVRA